MKIKQLANQDIRQVIKDAQLRHFEIFSFLGVSEATWTRKIRQPLSAEDKAEILDIVKALSTEGRC